jgi:uncharacterized protein YggU (UPF0235/DUF167 family)
LKIIVKVKTNSRENSVKQLKNNRFEVKLSVPPEKGKANQMVIELISKHLKVPKSCITIISGLTYKEKILQISS